MKKISSYQKLKNKNKKMHKMIYQLVMEPEEDATLDLNVDRAIMYGKADETNYAQGIKD